jgi:hypothetical protein
MYFGSAGFVEVKMLASLSGVHGIVAPASADPPGFGADWSSHSAMPNQKAGCNWKLNVPPLPSCNGWVGGSVGSVIRYCWLLPAPGVFE